MDQNKETTKNYLWKETILLILVVILGFVLYTSSADDSTKDQAGLVEFQPSARELYYAPGNFIITIEPGWNIIEKDVDFFATSSATTHFAFEKQGTQCIGAYMRVPAEVLREYVQTSFAEQVDTSYGEQQWGSWYSRKSDLPIDHQFSWTGRQFLPHEIRMSYYPLSYNDVDSNFRKVLVLFSDDGSSVPSECDGAFSAMISSIKRHFETTTLTSVSAGKIYFQRLDNSLPVQLMYVADDLLEIPKQAMTFPFGFRIPTVYKNRTMLLTHEGVIKELDVFTGTISDIQGIVSEEGEQVNEFMIYKDRMFYLFGKNCLDYRDQCNLKLYEYDFKTESSRFLTASVTSRTIAGFDNKRNILGLYYSDGDAGCFWISAEHFVLSSGTLEHVGNFNDCYDVDDKKPEALVKFEQFLLLFDNEAKKSNYMRVRNGLIIFPEDKEPSWGWPINFVPI